MAKYRTFQVRLNTEKEARRIAWLEAQESITDAIRALIDQAVEGAGSEVDLDAIREMFEMVLDDKLAGLAVATAGGESFKEDEELAAKLDAMF